MMNSKGLSIWVLARGYDGRAHRVPSTKAGATAAVVILCDSNYLARDGQDVGCFAFVRYFFYYFLKDHEGAFRAVLSYDKDIVDNYCPRPIHTPCPLRNISCGLEGSEVGKRARRSEFYKCRKNIY